MAIYGARLLIAVLATVLGGTVTFAGVMSDATPPTAVENPYCAVPTVTKPGVPEQARARLDAEGKPIILMDRGVFKQPDYARFLMAHECCHHTLGHLDRLQRQLAQVGSKPFSAIAGSVRTMELEADCCAAKILRQRSDQVSIDAAKRNMASFGGIPTGAYYPNGIERSYVISDCGK